MQAKTPDAFDQLCEIENPRNIASTIFSHYDQHGTGILGRDQVAQMMRDCYKMIDPGFQPSEDDLKSYGRILDRNKDGQVTL